MISCLIAALLAVAPAPSYLVERIVSREGGVHRVSVFGDGVLVVADTPAGGAATVRRRTLNQVELSVIRSVVAECYEALEDGKYRFEEVRGERVEVRLAPPGHEAMRAVVPLASVRPLPLARLEQALDELEKTLAEGPPVRGDFSTWIPRVGERLELVDGQVVTVTEVLAVDEGVLVNLQIGGGPASTYVFLDELRGRVVRRVER
ncbi:MAG: hypothetical protein HXY19_05785 [Thermoanaerobaculaceae bacterium]|nr:hypothetical protein [Thermoanaerobaculaceae bacterium]